MSKANIEIVNSVLSCGKDTARHYLSLFDNDVERSIQVVTTYGHNPDWWGHPANIPRESRVQDLQDEDIMEVEEEQEEEEEEEEVSRSDIDDVETIESDWYPNDDDVRVDDIENDRGFYDRYSSLVNAFVDAVCDEERKNELRILVSEADRQIAIDTGMILEESDLINRLSFKHDTQDGRSPLSYAVAKNMKQQVYNLLDLGADIRKTMPSEKISDRTHHTALTIAASNQKRDGAEMVRILLSKGASPSELVSANVEENELSRGMRYWIEKARRVGVPAFEEVGHFSKLPPMDRIHELDYAVVGQEAAISSIQDALAGRFGNPEGNRKPLVLLLLGPPGHGKTYFSSNTARSLVGEENFLFVPCQSIRDDADLFGSRLGGSRKGNYSSDGQLTAWLRQRQGKKCIVFLDEFEKMKDLTSSIGWGQAKKIYQSFLEPWNDGTLSDQSAMSSGGGDKIDCSQSIWILTSNWGQDKIIDFSETNKTRIHKKIDQKDVAWIQKELVSKILRPLCTREFASVHVDLKALCRRVDVIVPFLPFTTTERRVVADIALIERLSLYREHCVLSGAEEKRRSLGNLFLRSSKSFAAYVAGFYDPMQGASGMLSTVQQVDGKFQMMFLRNQLGLTDDQKDRVKSDKPTDNNSVEEPVFWVHYDKLVEATSITQSRPVDDDEDSMSDGNDENEDDKNIVEETIGLASKIITSEELLGNADGNQSQKKTRLGAADDAF